uniref:Uncharacterized protein n=1 Tax=Oryza punctata TaxID=4537 RepID=A0A0E0LUV8_ORYPU
MEAAEAAAVAKTATEAAKAVAVAKAAFEAAAAKEVAVAKTLAKEAAEVLAAKDLVEAAAKEAAEVVAVAKAAAEAAEAVEVAKAALEASVAVAKAVLEAAAKWAAEAKAAAEAAAEAKAAAEVTAVAKAVAEAAAVAVAKAAAARTQLGRRAFVVVGFAFAFGAVWLASAFRIANAVEHCLAVEVHWLADPMCRDTVVFAAPLAVASLILMAAAVRRQVKAEAEAGAQIREAAAVTHDVLPDPELQPPLPAPAVALDSGLERRLLLCGSDEVVMLTIISIYLCCVTFILVGRLLRIFGALFLVYYPGDELGIALLMGVGSGLKNVGYFWLAVGHFFLIIPYAVLRLRRFLNQFTSLTVSIFMMHVANKGN